MRISHEDMSRCVAALAAERLFAQVLGAGLALTPIESTAQVEPLEGIRACGMTINQVARHADRQLFQLDEPARQDAGSDPGKALREAALDVQQRQLVEQHGDRLLSLASEMERALAPISAILVERWVGFTDEQIPDSAEIEVDGSLVEAADVATRLASGEVLLAVGALTFLALPLWIG